jgi:hypothetical protein
MKQALKSCYWSTEYLRHSHVRAGLVKQSALLTSSVVVSLSILNRTMQALGLQLDGARYLGYMH